MTAPAINDPWRTGLGWETVPPFRLTRVASDGSPWPWWLATQGFGRRPAARRVLITGASGFVGANVLAYLHAHTDWTFTCLASWRHHGKPERLARYADDPRVEIVTCDLTGPLPDLGTFDTILHLASESHVDRSIAEPVAFVENNVASTLHVLEYARAHRPRVFVQFSTDEVYGATTGELGEWATILPSNPYAASKAAQEALACAWWRTYGVPVVITNTNNVIGPGQDAEKFLPRIVHAVRNGEVLSVHAQDGTVGSRHYNPVANVADALRFICGLHLPMAARPARFHLGGGEERTNLELALTVAGLLGRELRYTITEATDTRPGYDASYAHTSAAALGALGWVPVQSLDVGLAEAVCG